MKKLKKKDVNNVHKKNNLNLKSLSYKIFKTKLKEQQSNQIKIFHGYGKITYCFVALIKFFWIVTKMLRSFSSSFIMLEEVIWELIILTVDWYHQKWFNEFYKYEAWTRKSLKPKTIRFYKFVIKLSLLFFNFKSYYKEKKKNWWLF